MTRKQLTGETPDGARRAFLRGAGTAGLLAGVETLLPGYARGNAAPPSKPSRGPEESTRGPAVHELVIAETALRIGDRRGTATTINGTVPGPLLRLREGRETILRVTNKLDEDTSIHWHGILVPPDMDGVPGISFPGIRPGTTFEYRFPLKQYGTYWYHSHSALQEQLGHYGPLIVEPADGHPYSFDREYVVVLSDWTFENPYRVLAKLKKQPDYYNFHRRTVFDLFRDMADKGVWSTLRDRWMWADMRMNPTDISDVTGATYTFLMNGRAPESNWTGIFKPGERVLLRFINASADTFFDVRIPGLPMKLVQASGQYVRPVETDEIRIAIAETYDVIVEPREDRPYCVFAEAMDRSGFAAGTLATRPGPVAARPPRRRRPVLSMADMGMEHGSPAGGGMDHRSHGSPARSGSQDHGSHGSPASSGGMDHGSHDSHGSHGTARPAETKARQREGAKHDGHEPKSEPSAEQASSAESDDSDRYARAGAVRRQGLRPPGTLPGMVEHERDTHGPGNAAVPAMVKSRLRDPGIGLGQDGWRVLVYSDLQALERRPDFKAPEREIEMHLTGNMERFMWSLDGVPFSQSEPIRLTHGERLRLTMVNDTMMNHPMHLHGMWMELENGHREMIPRVHTVNVKPAERLSLLITADAPGRWAFHCHVLYHMEVGMFRVVEVSHPRDHVSQEKHHGGG
jgi:CopA family copper-resistance protein